MSLEAGEEAEIKLYPYNGEKIRIIAETWITDADGKSVRIEKDVTEEHEAQWRERERTPERQLAAKIKIWESKSKTVEAKRERLATKIEIWELELKKVDAEQTRLAGKIEIGRLKSNMLEAERVMLEKKIEFAKNQLKAAHAKKIAEEGNNSQGLQLGKK